MFDKNTISIGKVKMKDFYLWDLGIIKLLGNEEYPLTADITNMHTFSSIVNNQDFNAIQNKNITIEELTVYEGDYVIYVPTTKENAECYINPEENILLRVLEKDVTSFNSDMTGKLVEEKKFHKRHINNIFYTEEELNEFIPVLQI